jgi:hypothetical protein
MLLFGTTYGPSICFYLFTLNSQQLQNWTLSQMELLQSWVQLIFRPSSSFNWIKWFPKNVIMITEQWCRSGNWDGGIYRQKKCNVPRQTLSVPPTPPPVFNLINMCSQRSRSALNWRPSKSWNKPGNQSLHTTCTCFIQVISGISSTPEEAWNMICCLQMQKHYSERSTTAVCSCSCKYDHVHVGNAWCGLLSWGL